MYQTRQAASIKLPIKRKGTKYVAKALSHVRDSVPVVIAVRDMLKLARTAREVKKMIKEKMLKINGRPSKDYRESICLFNIFEADKIYRLSIMRTGKFIFEEMKKNENRLCRITGKRLVSGGKIQLNFHDGTSVLTEKKEIGTGGSVYIDQKGKIASHIPFEKGREVFVIKGKHQGLSGSIESIEKKKIIIKFQGGKTADLRKDTLFVIK